LDNRVDYLKTHGDALSVDMRNAINHEHRYVGTPYIFGGTATYNAGKKRNGIIEYSFMPFVQSTYVDGLGTLTREERLDFLILHESNHFGKIVLDYDPNTYTGTLGPRKLGVGHEKNYDLKVRQDFIKTHPIYAF